MTKKLSIAQEDQLRQLIKNHNKLCDNFNKDLRAIMDEIYQLCEPAGISVGRIATFEHGQEVTRIQLFPKTSMADELDTEWLKSLWAEDDRL